MIFFQDTYTVLFCIPCANLPLTTTCIKGWVAYFVHQPWKGLRCTTISYRLSRPNWWISHVTSPRNWWRYMTITCIPCIWPKKTLGWEKKRWKKNKKNREKKTNKYSSPPKTIGGHRLRIAKIPLKLSGPATSRVPELCMAHSVRFPVVESLWSGRFPPGISQMHHGAGIFTYIETPKMAQFCRFLYTIHRAS